MNRHTPRHRLKPRSVLLQVVLERRHHRLVRLHRCVFGDDSDAVVDMAFGSSDFMRNPTIDISIA